MADDGPVDKAAFVMPLIPAELRVHPILASLIHCMAFLELSGDEAIDPDWALEAMEHVEQYLQRLPPDELVRIAQQLAVLSAHARAKSFPEPFVLFLDRFLEYYAPPPAKA